MRGWKSESELAAMLKARGMAGRTAVLSADTALFVGFKMETASKKPTVDEVARELCRRDCAARCYECTGQANKIVRLYGLRANLP